MHFMMASGRPSGKLRLVAHTMQGLLVIPPDITIPRPQEPPKELELPEQASASPVQPAASASPEEPSAEETADPWQAFRPKSVAPDLSSREIQGQSGAPCCS